MAIDITLTSVLYNPWSASGGEALSGSGSDILEVSYASLDFVASTSDSYKSTAGDIFKVYIDGTRIYRTSDSLYAGGKNFLETGDVDNSILNGVTSQTWSSNTSDTVWEIDTASQKVKINKTAIAATSLYRSGGGAAVNFAAGAIIEVRRSVQDQSSPAVDFSNASILTEQDLDNSSANVFHMAQQAIETAGNALPYETGTGVYEAYQPGTVTKKRITQVAAPTANDDVVTKTYMEDTWLTATDKTNSATVAGISANVTTVAGIASNVTAVAGDATDIGVVAGKATEIERLGTADTVADMVLLGTTDCVADMALLGTADCVADMALLGTADCVADMNTLATNDIVADLNTLATSDIVDDLAILGDSAIVTNLATVSTNVASVNTAATNIANINTAVSNIATINDFADKYRIASSAPGSDNNDGDLYYNTQTNQLNVHDGSNWGAIGLTQAQTQTEANNASVAMSIALG